MSDDLIVPATGETLDLATAPPEKLASLYDELGDLTGRIREARSAIAIEVNRRMDLNASWTLHTADWKLSGQSPSRVEYDAERLWLELDVLVEDGTITPDARDHAVKIVTRFSVQAGGVRNLYKLGDPVAAAIDRCTTPAGGARRLTVTREGT